MSIRTTAIASTPRRVLARAVAAVAVTALALTGCGDSQAETVSGPASELRLGYFANVTHATALYGIATGGLQQALGSTKLETTSFNAGPAAIEALRSGGLDATFIGPNPAINGFAQTDGKLLRIVAGTTSGGAALVVKPEITSVEQLAGKTVATPQLGNTQDVAAKAFFEEKGLDVTIINQENAQTLELLRSGAIDGGWVPEPWASRLVLDGGGKVLVDEATLWPQGQFVTTHLVVRTEFLEDHPETVDALLKGLIAAHDVVATKSADVQAKVNGQIKADTGKELKPEILASSFATLTPTLDPIASSLAESAKDAQSVGVLRPVELKGIYDLSRLNALLTAAGTPAVTDAGLGT